MNLKLKFWAKRIHKEMGLTKSFRLHIIEDEKVHELRYESSDSILFRTDELGCYTIFDLQRFHHITLRKQAELLDNAYILAHEFCHARQLEHTFNGDGQRMRAAYDAQQLTKGYEHNIYEIEAREVGIEWAEHLYSGGPYELVNFNGARLRPKLPSPVSLVPRFTITADAFSKAYYSDTLDEKVQNNLEASLHRLILTNIVGDSKAKMSKIKLP